MLALCSIFKIDPLNRDIKMSFSQLKKLPSNAAVLDIEDGANAREKHVAKMHITWTLNFINPIDEQLYLVSLKNLFFFPTFWPIMVVFLAFIATQNGILEEIQGSDAFIAIAFAFNIINLFFIVIFTLAQCIDYFSQRSPLFLILFSRYILRSFLKGRIEDIIVLFLSMAQGFYQMSLISRDLCVACGSLFAIEQCEANREKIFPLGQGMIGYLSILILSIYFKSINRHMILLSWVILTIFIIAAHGYGHYRLRFITAVMIVFFFVSIIEYERYKMTAYLLSKEALSLEKSKFFIMQEKSKIIERKLHMALVHQILPPKVAEQIIAGKQVAPESFEEVTIFFSDVEGFTTICSQVSPAGVVQMLNDLYTVMDYCTSLFPVYKVETIGDAYMLVGGLPERNAYHAQHIADFALLVRHAVNSVKSPIDQSSIRIRIGLHSGPVMAGVVGNLMPRYCLFGDTVNTASRMESNGQPGLIHTSQKTAQLLLKSGKYNVSERGEIEVKGKGKMFTYWLDSAREENVHANSEAIHKCQRMVEDLLSANHLNNDTSEGDGNHAPMSLLQQAAMMLNEASNTNSNNNVTNMIMEEIENIDDEYFDKNFKNNNNNNNVTNVDVMSITSADSTDISLAKQTNNNCNINSKLSPRPQQYVIATNVNDKSKGLRHVASVGSRPSMMSSQNTATHQPLSHSNINHNVHGQSLPASAFSFLQNNTVNNASSENNVVAFDSTGAKILVVEDSMAQRKMLIKRLTEADSSWDVSAAVSGEDALAKLKAARFGFDVVFVDENLSESNGLFGHELVQVMRNSFNMKHTIIIACTSNPARVGKDLIDAGVDFVWPKPPPLSSVIKTKINLLLEARLKQLLQKSHQTQTGDSDNTINNANNNINSSATNNATNPRNSTFPKPSPLNFTSHINLNFLRSFTGGNTSNNNNTPVNNSGINSFSVHNQNNNNSTSISTNSSSSSSNHSPVKVYPSS